MDNTVNIQQALNVYAKIISYGQKEGEEFFLDGIFASSDHDGYTVYLRDDYVAVEIYFHNTFRLNSNNMISLDLFWQKITLIDDKSFSTAM